VADHAVDGLSVAPVGRDQPDRARRRRVEVGDDEQPGVGVKWVAANWGSTTFDFTAAIDYAVSYVP
jgi:hypothetical protein